MTIYGQKMFYDIIDLFINLFVGGGEGMGLNFIFIHILITLLWVSCVILNFVEVDIELL